MWHRVHHRILDRIEWKSQVGLALSGLPTTTIEQDQKRDGSWRSVSSSEFLRLPISTILSKLHSNVTRTTPGIEISSEVDIEGGIIDNAKKMANSTRDNKLRTHQTQHLVFRRNNEGNDQDGFYPDKNRNFASFPNLALMGLSGLWSAAILGVLLQASFFVYATWTTRYKASVYKDKRIPSNPGWFSLTVTGTTFIVIGMALCVQVIDEISQERRLVFYGTDKPRMFWLQPAGRRIGDQEFDGFAYNQIKTDYITSWKRSGLKFGCYRRVWFAVAFSIGVWVM